MNRSLSPESSAEVLASNKVGGFAYGIVFSVGIIFLITTILVASYLCTRTNTTPPHPAPALGGADVERGLDESTLGSYPKVRYSELPKLGRSGKGSCSCSAAACCSICLADYNDEDEIRQLPACGHEFHLKCVDPWLRLHTSCPVCRTSPLPPTPLAEVVPLARQEVR